MATKKFLEKLANVSPVDILGENYHIVLHDKRWIQEGSPGTVNFPHRKIYLDTALENNAILSLLIHEVLEVLNDRFDLHLEHNKICILGELLIYIFKKNTELGPLFTKFITDCSGNLYDFKDFEETKNTQVEGLTP